MTALSGVTNAPPVFFTGRRIKNCTILPLTQAADGSFTKGTVGDLCSAQTVEYVRFRNDTTKEEISGANTTVENDVILKNKFIVEVGEIKLADESANISMAAYGAFDYFLVTKVTSPDGGTTKYYTQAIISRSSLDDEAAVGKSTIAFIGSCAGINVAQSVGTPTWS